MNKLAAWSRLLRRAVRRLVCGAHRSREPEYESLPSIGQEEAFLKPEIGETAEEFRMVVADLQRRVLSLEIQYHRPPPVPPRPDNRYVVIRPWNVGSLNYGETEAPYIEWLRELRNLSID